ncbi:MAG: TetR/AcrR family transcriptional regulator [Myxococcales bacterium]|nr:MAG: TetR/AcrR family transcriptional regulator [Myxococcales bacterium]
MASRKSEQSITHIVEAATHVIARQGYAHTSLLDIAKEAGMSKGAVHYHFPTKEALISEVLEHACTVVQKRTQEAWDQGGDALESVRAALHELWHVRAGRSDEAAVVADLLAQSLHDPSLRPKLAGYYRLAASQVTEHLAPHIKALGLKPKVPLSFCLAY